MKQKIYWDKNQIAKNYEIGRPLSAQAILELFNKITTNLNVPLNNESHLLDAGCGTVRVTMPLAQAFPKLAITGIDISPEMLEIARQKIEQYQLKNYKLIEADLHHIDIDDNQIDFTLISSVLHVIPNWQQIIDEMIRVTKLDGYLLLISEKADIYEIEQGRAKPQDRNLLEKFWGQFQKLKHEYELSIPKKIQVGIRWQLGCPEIVDYLKKKGHQNINTVTIPWKHKYTVADFMNILYKKCWSALFTSDPVKYDHVVKKMEEWLQQENISLDEQYNSQNYIRCEIIKLTKKLVIKK